MARTATSHLIVFLLLAFFASIFGAFLVYASYKYFTDGDNMTIKAFAPGVPAFFLSFMARNELRAFRAARKSARVRRARAARHKDQF